MKLSTLFLGAIAMLGTALPKTVVEKLESTMTSEAEVNGATMILDAIEVNSIGYSADVTVFGINYKYDVTVTPDETKIAEFVGNIVKVLETMPEDKKTIMFDNFVNGLPPQFRDQIRSYLASPTPAPDNV